MKTKAEKIEDLAKRRGIFWQGSEIYGGLGGFYDYGFIGTAIKHRFENLWRRWFLQDDNFYEIDPVNIMHEQTFAASGHLMNFADPTARCKKCGTVHRADHILEEFLHESFEGLTSEQLHEIIRKHNVKCPNCKGPLEEIGTFNMMFPVSVGAGGGGKAITAYLRPETAQGVYVNFRRIYEQARKALPLGIAVIGKAFRNEISPRQLLIRMREFTQAEVQIFFDPEKINTHPDFDKVSDYELRLFSVVDRKMGDAAHASDIACHDAVKKLHLPQFYVYYLAKIQKFYLDVLRIPRDKFRFRELSEEERAFYNKLHWDVEIELDGLGFKEVAGLHYRSDHDLAGHAGVSKQTLTVNFEGRTFMPHVLEVSFGVDRNIYAVLDMAYTEDEAHERALLRLSHALSPFDAVVAPLVEKDGLPEKARDIVEMLRKTGFAIFSDPSGSIGRRYRRADEIGIGLCITIDHQSLEDSTVTLRDRDSMKQVRAKISDLPEKIKLFISGTDFEKLGERVK